MRAAETRAIEVPARAAAALRLAAGETVTIVDVAGHQGADCVAFALQDGSLSSTQETRARLRRLFPRPGEAIHSDSGLPLLVLVADTSPGPHGLLVPPCDGTMYRLRGGGCGHASCHDNLHAAMTAEGHPLGRTPPSICLFQNITVSPEGAIAIGVNASKAGDAVTFRVETDLVLAVSACPNDLFKRPPLAPTGLRILVR